jgi:hypothetical protein
MSRPVETYPPRTHLRHPKEPLQGVINNAMQGDALCGCGYVYLTEKIEEVTCQECLTIKGGQHGHVRADAKP